MILNRLEKVGSQNAYQDLRSFWYQCTKKQRYTDTYAPHLPTIKEVEKVRDTTLAADGVIVYQREVTSLRAISSNVEINGEYFPRNCTCLLTLRWPVAETCVELIDEIKKISLTSVLKLIFN